MSHSSPACSQATDNHGEPASSGAAAEGSSDFGALPQHQVTIFSRYTPPARQWVAEICLRVSVAQHMNGTGLLGAVSIVRFARLSVVRVFRGGNGGSGTCPPDMRAGNRCDIRSAYCPLRSFCLDVRPFCLDVRSFCLEVGISPGSTLITDSPR